MGARASVPCGSPANVAVPLPLFHNLSFCESARSAKLTKIFLVSCPFFATKTDPTLIWPQGQQRMPRKIRPKYGIDPVQEIPPFSFADTAIERLLIALGPVNGNREDIIARLAKCAREYRWRRKQNLESPTRAEQNAALKEVCHLARGHGIGLRRLEKTLRTLDIGTEWELVIRSPALDPIDLGDGIANLADGLEHLAQIADQALRTGEQKSGPRVKTHVHRTVVKLASLYEEFTGKRFSHNPKLLTEYNGEPHSPAGRFIATSSKLLTPT